MRTFEQRREHYHVEKELADRLRGAPREGRLKLYAEVYEELFLRVGHHEQLTQKVSPEETMRYVQYQLKLLQSFLSSDATFLEIGAGDCALSYSVAPLVKQVYAVDVSARIAEGQVRPSNFALILSDGVSIDLPPNSVRVAYSNQLMEHLHPDDALEQLRNIHRVLVPGGYYICIAPNRLTGPHDISQFFDNVATGLHLKEYTVTELGDLFLQVGFAQIQNHLPLRGRYFAWPLWPFRLCVAVLGCLPAPACRSVSRCRLFRWFLEIRLVGVKR